MKNSMMRKNLRQSIKKSIGRYIAIVSIIALGAGLFCGLRVTKKDMIATVQRYTDEQNMFDVQVMNTYGWTDDDVYAFRQVPGVAAAEGTKALDALAHFEGSEDSVYKLISIPEQVNCISLDAGRMPQAPDECLADSFFMSEAVIGSTLYISDANEETALEGLACDSYTVVGTCSTPLYLNMQRGSTTIGNGSLSTYFYIPPEGFSLEVYTQIDIAIEGSFDVYTDEYDDAMDAMAEKLEVAAGPLAQVRYETVKRDAEKEYADGMREYKDGLKEYNDGRAEAEKALAEAEKELADGEAEIKKNRILLEDGQKALEDGQKLLDDSLATIVKSRSDLAAARTEAYQQLADANEELFANYKQVVDGLNKVEGGIAQIDNGLVQIDAGITQIENGQTQLELSLSLLDTMLPIAERSLKTAQATLDALKGQTGLPDYEERLADAQKQLDDATAVYNDYITQRDELLKTQAEIAEQLPALQQQRAELVAQRAELEATRTELEAALDTIEIGFKEAENAQKQADNQFAAAEAQLDAAELEAKAGQETLDQKRAELETGLEELEKAEKELAEGKAEYEAEKEKVLSELADAEAELLDAEAQLADARQTIDALEEPDIYALTRNTNLGYVVLENDSDIVDGVAKIFPAFFLAVAALVCITTMTRMVDEERTQIGILKALGYSNGAIMGKYLAYSGSGALLGCAAGVGLGSAFFPQVIWFAYCIMYNFSDTLVLTLDIPTITFIIVSYTALTLLVTWYCCRQSLKEVPAELIRPKAPTSGKQIFLERFGFWKKLKFLDKVAVRNILRYRQRFAMMLLGIGGCTALLVTGFGLNDSISDIVSYQFESVTLYDIGVTFAEPQTKEQQEQFRLSFRGKADQVLFCQEGSVDLEFDHSVKNVNFLVTDRKLDGFFDLHDGKQSLPMPANGQALISVGAATSMGIEPGDTVVLRNADLAELEVTVSGIFDNHVYNYAIVSADTVRTQWGHEPELSSAFVVNGPRQDVHQLGAEIAQYDHVMSVAINEDLANTVGSMMDALDAVIVLIVFCAGLLATIVLYNLTNINIKERIREIATIKVLGFNAAETGAYVFKENLSLTVIGTLVGLVGGYFLHKIVMSYVRIDMVWFADRINWYSYIFAAVLTLVAALLVDFAMYFQLDKINMAEALKSVE